MYGTSFFYFDFWGSSLLGKSTMYMPNIMTMIVFFFQLFIYYEILLDLLFSIYPNHKYLLSKERLTAEGIGDMSC